MSFYRDTTGNEVDRGPVLLTVWRGTELVNRWSQGSMISSEGQGAMRPQQWPHVGLLGQGQLLRKSDNSERNLKEKERFGCSHKKFMGAFNVDLFGVFFVWQRQRQDTATQSGSLWENRGCRDDNPFMKLEAGQGDVGLDRGLRLKGDSFVSFSKLESPII